MSMKIFRLILLLIFLQPVFAVTPTVDESELHSDEDQERATEIILHIIENYHYRTRPLDDTLSSEIFDTYLESMDPNKSFFNRADIDEFEKYRYTLDDLLDDSELTPAFDIFKRYRSRVQERVEYALSILEGEFDFSIDENYQFDRSELDWSNETELNDIWRKRVKNDFLNLKLADKPETEIRETLGKRYLIPAIFFNFLSMPTRAV